MLWLAGLYNLAWGAFAVLFPSTLFHWCGMAPPDYLWLWQCIGMIVGVYGVGYLIAARDPRRHWPIVLVGLLGKIFGPLGFAMQLADGAVPLRFGATILTNDLIWWVPFTLLLWDAARSADAPASNTPLQSVAEALATRSVEGGRDAGVALDALSRSAPLLIVFLRHSGCTFCREALADLAAQRTRIEADGTRLLLVHLASDADAAAFFRGFRLDDVARIADPQRSLYRAFALGRGSFWQLFGPRIWWRGFMAGVVRGHGVGRLAGDGFQMPGTFLVKDGAIVAGRAHRDAAERPDYAALACSVRGPSTREAPR